MKNAQVRMQLAHDFCLVYLLSSSHDFVVMFQMMLLLRCAFCWTPLCLFRSLAKTFFASLSLHLELSSVTISELKDAVSLANRSLRMTIYAASHYMANSILNVALIM